MGYLLLNRYFAGETSILALAHEMWWICILMVSDRAGETTSAFSTEGVFIMVSTCIYLSDCPTMLNVIVCAYSSLSSY